MIKQKESGEWEVAGVNQQVALVPNAEMQQFIHEQAQKLADRALAILIEHQRHTLLPQQREGE